MQHTSKGGEMKMTPPENNGSVVTQHPTSGVDLEEVTAFTVHIHQSIHQKWVKTLGYMMWQ